MGITDINDNQPPDLYTSSHDFTREKKKKMQKDVSKLFNLAPPLYPAL